MNRMLLSLQSGTYCHIPFICFFTVFVLHFPVYNFFTLQMIHVNTIIHIIRLLYLKGGQSWNFLKHDLEVVVDPKDGHPMGQLFGKIWGTIPLRALIVASPIFLPKVQSYGQKTHAQNLWACTPYKYLGNNIVKYNFFWMKPMLIDLYQWITYCLSFIALFMLNCPFMAIKPLKMDKIYHIFVCVFVSTSFAKLVITFAFFNIFPWNAELTGILAGFWLKFRFRFRPD